MVKRLTLSLFTECSSNHVWPRLSAEIKLVLLLVSVCCAVLFFSLEGLRSQDPQRIPWVTGFLGLPLSSHG